MTISHAPAVSLETKELSEDGTFSGYASTFGNVDLGGDIIVQGAFAETLTKRPPSKVKMLRDHDMRSMVGVWTEAREDNTGLHVTGRLLLNTERGRETYELMKAGALDSLSVGYRTLGEEYAREEGRSVRRIKSVDLMEVSIVPFPMNERAVINSVKGDGDDRPLPAERELEDVLRDAGLSRTEAKALIAGRSLKSLQAARDARSEAERSAITALASLTRAMRGGA